MKLLSHLLPYIAHNTVTPRHNATKPSHFVSHCDALNAAAASPIWTHLTAYKKDQLCDFLKTCACVYDCVCVFVLHETHEEKGHTPVPWLAPSEHNCLMNADAERLQTPAPLCTAASWAHRCLEPNLTH